MSKYWILVAILLPIIGGVLVPLLPLKKRGHMMIFLEAITLITSAVVWALLLGGTTEVFHVVRFVKDLSISLR